MEKRARTASKGMVMGRDGLVAPQAYIHLTRTDGLRELVTCNPYNVYCEGGTVYARVTLWGKEYRCRLMEKVPAYRLCNEKGQFIEVQFPEIPLAPPRVWDNEARTAAPFSWDEDYPDGKEMESKPKHRTANTVRTRRAGSVNSVD